MSHHYMNFLNCVNRLVEEWTEHEELIVAYDFDNTVSDYHGAGHDYTDVIRLLRSVKNTGAYLIVFTAAEEERYDEIRTFLEENDIPYDSINENKPGLPFKGRKLYYNILLDDRAGLESAYQSLYFANSIIRERREGITQ
jgi:hypothetical protein